MGSTHRPVIFIGDPKVVLGGNIRNLTMGRPTPLPYAEVNEWRTLGNLLIKTKAQGLVL